MLCISNPPGFCQPDNSFRKAVDTNAGVAPMQVCEQKFPVIQYSKTCLKRNAIVPVFFSPPFSQVSVLQRVVS